MTKAVDYQIDQIKNSETFKIVQNDTDLDRIEEIVANMRKYFNTGATLPYEFRKKQLKKFYKAIDDNEKAIFDAVRTDMGKPDYEILISETGVTKLETSFALKHLKGWMKKKKAKTPFYNFGTKSYRYASPKGVVLVIGPWNYPFQLVMVPVLGALAAGCCVVIKPPDYAYETSKIIKKMISENFDENYVKVIEADGSGTEKLLQQKWDHMFYTGGTRVGKIVYQHAVKNLTTVTLELGGVNPAIIDKNVNIGKAVDAIMFGKWLNLGQTCIAPNTLYIHEDVQEEFTQKLLKKMKKTFGDNPRESKVLARINNPNHHQRLVSLLDDGKAIIGGKQFEQELFIEPTVLVEADRDKSKVVNQEIFGPILPLVPFNDTTFTLDNILEKVNSGEEPLTVYLFSNDKKVHEKVVSRVRSQNLLINDTLTQFTNSNLPFGGVASSGIGGYHGYYTFEQFSIIKSVMNQNLPTLIHTLRWVRRPPYNRVKMFMTRFFFR